jgi:hypothetical protein
MTRPPRARVRLPKYLRSKRLAERGADGRPLVAYYWERPSWAKPPAERHGRRCPVDSEALGTDLAAAIGKAERLNAQFDEWRLGAEAKPAEGTIKWLFGWYRGQDRYKKLKAVPRKSYARAMTQVEEHKLKSGAALGSRRAAEITAVHADKLYAAMVEAHGKRAGAYCMQVCRRVWFEAARHGKLPGGAKAVNPFSRMDLDMVAEKGNRATSREEYVRFREQARAMGIQSMATAAAISFELVRRVSDVFGYEHDGEEASGCFYWEDYEPGEAFAMRQGKTGDRQRIPLRGRPNPDVDGDRGPLLYPDLEEELARTARGQPDAVVAGRPMTTIVIDEARGRRYDESRAQRVFRKIRDAAGLPAEMTLTGFRHGGATELGDAEVFDIRPISGHRTLRQTGTYNKVTEAKARRAGEKRRRHVTGSQRSD